MSVAGREGGREGGRGMYVQRTIQKTRQHNDITYHSSSINISTILDEIFASW
jgi:hypothetical protein